MAPILEVQKVTKIFRVGLWKKKTAVEDLSFTVHPGKVVGLLGPNGSGKSTTLKMLLGFLRPTRGTLLIQGKRPQERQARENLGYLPENPRFQKFLTGSEILSYYGKLLGLQGEALQKRVTELLERVGLRHAGKDRVQGYSKGMTQRLAIAQALLNYPPLLIFDEPMSGLDPLGRMEIRNIIAQIHTEMPHTTIFFSTHILPDVEQLCEEVLLLKKGKLKTHGPLQSLFWNEERLFDLTVEGLSEAQIEPQRKQANQFRKIPAGFQFTFQGTQLLSQSIAALEAAGGKVVGVDTHRRNLEQALFADEKGQTEGQL